MPTNPTWEDTVDETAVPSWDDTTAEEEPDFRRDELAKQTFEARLEGERGKLYEGLADLGSEGAKAIVRAASHVDPTGFTQGLMQQYGVEPTHVIPPEMVQQDVETVSRFAGQGLRNLGIEPQTIIPERFQKPLQEFAAENIAALPEMAPLMAAGIAEPKTVGRLFQTQMLQGVPQSAYQAATAETPEEGLKAGLGAAAGLVFPAAIELGLRPKAQAIPDFTGRSLERPKGAIPPKGEPIVPVERVTPEQSALAAERMSAPFEEKLATEPTVLAPEKVDLKPVDKPMNAGERLAAEVEAEREASEAAFKAKQGKPALKPATTLQKLIETLGRDEVAGLVDQWEQGAELHPDGKSITVYADPRNQTGKMRGKTKDFLSWYEEQKSTPPAPEPAKAAAVESPVEAAAKVETEVKSVANMEGKRSAIDIKNDLIEMLQQKLQKAPPQKDWDAAIEKPNFEKSVTVEIPGDGTFTVPNTIEAIASVLDRARKIKTDPGKPVGVTKAQIKSSQKVLDMQRKNAPVPEIETPPTPPKIEGMGQGPGARTGVTIEAPESYSGTALKNAVAEVERESWGMPEADSAIRRNRAEAWIRAGRTLERDPQSGQKLVDDLKSDPGRGLTFDESALLLRHKRILTDEMNGAAERTHTAISPEEKAKAQADYDLAHENMLTMLDTIKSRGTAWGQEGVWRQVMAREDYSLATLITNREKALGRELKPGTPEFIEVENHAKRLQETNDKLTERIAKVESDFEASEIKRAIAESEARAKRELPYHPRILELAEGYAKKWDERGAQALADLKALFGGGDKPMFAGAPITPEMLDKAIIYGTSKIVRGAVDFAKWSDAMVRDLGPGFVNHAKDIWEASKKAFDKDVAAAFKKQGAATVQKVKGALKESIPGTGTILKKIQRKVEESKGVLPDLKYYFDQLLDFHVRRGLKEEGPLLDAIHADAIKAIPDLTKRETREILAGYGTPLKPLAKDIVSVIKRDMHGQWREISKIDMIKRGIFPPKLQERAEMMPKQRWLRKQYEAEKRLHPEVVPTDIEGQLKTAMQAAKTRITNQITDLEHQIQTRTKIVKESKRLKPDAELERLTAIRDEMRAVYDTVFKKPELTDAERLEIWKERTRDRIEELQDKRANRDFKPRPQPDPIRYDKEAIELQYQLEVEHRALMEMRHKDELSKRNTSKVILDSASNAAMFAHMAMAGGEFSAVFKQGATGAYGRPITTAKNFAKSLQAWWSEENQFKIKHEILTRDNSPSYRRDKLEFTSMGGRLSTMEEMYMFRMMDWMKKVPGLSHYLKYMDRFQRAFSTFLDLMRADTYDAMVKEMGPSREAGETAANYINVATGRGSHATARFGGQGANAIFFAPRWSISRFQYLFGQPILAAKPGFRGAVIKQYARTMIGLGSVYALGYAAGGKVDWDPRSSLFGKIQLAGRVIDPLFGLAPVIRLLAQQISGTRKNYKGKIRPIREGGKLPYFEKQIQGSKKLGPFDPSGSELIGKFAWSKLAPAPEAFVSGAGGENVIGETFTLPEKALQMVTPITYGDILSAIKQQGIEPATAIDLMSIWGMGSYIPTEKKPKY